MPCPLDGSTQATSAAGAVSDATTIGMLLKSTLVSYLMFDGYSGCLFASS